MSKLFFGKISSAYPEQFEKNFYAGGALGSSWYNGLQSGDLVFPIFKQSIAKLWKVIDYDPSPNHIDSGGSIRFEILKVFDDPIAISNTFVRYRHFELDLIMLNKALKSTAREKIGFYPITCSANCPPADQIDFSDLRNIYVSLDTPFNPLPYKEDDIRLLVGDIAAMTIKEVQIFQNNHFIQYDVLNNLYLSKNQEGERYSLLELLAYADSDSAKNKKKFLTAAIQGLKTTGYYSVSSPVALYDNIIVGRKKTSMTRTHEELVTEEVSTIESSEDLLLQEESIDYEEYREYVELLKTVPNLILYGPPGTGKTYTAEKIIEAFEYFRTNQSFSIDQLQEEGRVNFVTFHQSFSYEEFVEGIRPVVNLDEKEPSTINSNNISYKIQDGILKKIANKAALGQITENSVNDHYTKMNENSRIWKISLGERNKDEEVYESCINSNTIAIGWFDNTDMTNWDYERIYSKLNENLVDNSPNPKNNTNSINNFINEVQEGDLVLVLASQTAIRAIGLVVGPYEWKQEYIGKYAHRRKVKWLKIYDSPVDIIKYNGGKNLSQVTLYELTNIRFLDIKEILKPEKKFSHQAKNMVPYFLIIDEINRGNISKIFGEMITLVEEDKRDRVKIILPFSQKTFSLPSNLYIIGTMNTADRSIAVIDTALRRRFLFKELEPSIKIIRNKGYSIDSDLDLSKLADTLNSKIERMLDRDHRIGHSYFMNDFDINQFKIKWYYQIIPLLMEYFYNDPARIAEIISEAFIDKTRSEIKWIDDNNLFKQALKDIVFL